MLGGKTINNGRSSVNVAITLAVRVFRLVKFLIVLVKIPIF